MKNKFTNEASAPANAVQQSSRKTAARAKINWAKRNANRVLNTEALLALLRTETPGVFNVAEVVGKWVWVQFSDIPAVELRRQLAELGFHWNNARQTWQHPCGIYRDRRTAYDPRRKYGSYFPADHQAA